MRTERVTGSVAPDQLAGRATGVVRTAEDRAVAAATRADRGVAQTPRATMSAVSGAAAPPPPAVPRPAAECYRVESANGIAATWGADALPLVVRVDSAGRAAVFTVAGQATGSQASVTRAGDDSLLLRLRRLGFEGSLALGAPGDVRAGVMRSRPAELRLEETVVTATGAEEPRDQRGRARAAKRVPQAAPPPPPVAEVRSAVTAAPAVPVVARRIGCPS
jgi:hypothetical protein